MVDIGNNINADNVSSFNAFSNIKVPPPGLINISSDLTIAQSFSVTTEVSYSSLLAEYNFWLYYVIDKNYN